MACHISGGVRIFLLNDFDWKIFIFFFPQSDFFLAFPYHQNHVPKSERRRSLSLLSSSIDSLVRLQNRPKGIAGSFLASSPTTTTNGTDVVNRIYGLSTLTFSGLRVIDAAVKVSFAFSFCTRLFAALCIKRWPKPAPWRP